MVLLGDGVPAGVRDVPTSHVDVVPTLLSLLGDTHAPALYSDGLSMFEAPPDRFVLTTVGWEPHYAVIGKDLKVTMYAGFGDARITDPEDRDIPDAEQRFGANAGKILKALGR
jgi:membrane-anchored protein YejM (alkaline phosphatase superfamily)